MDVVSHRIVTALGSAAPGTVIEEKMRNANVACRKLASEHPLLLLRLLYSMLFVNFSSYFFQILKYVVENTICTAFS